MNVSVYKDAILKKRVELEETAGLTPLSVRGSRTKAQQGDLADHLRATTTCTFNSTETDRRQDPEAIDEALMV